MAPIVAFGKPTEVLQVANVPDVGAPGPNEVVIALEASAAGTKVTIIHDGFAGTGRADWPEMVADYERGSDAHGILDILARLVNDDAD